MPGLSEEIGMIWDADAGIFYNILIGFQSKNRAEKADADARKGNCKLIKAVNLKN